MNKDGSISVSIKSLKAGKKNNSIYIYLANSLIDLTAR